MAALARLLCLLFASVLAFACEPSQKPAPAASPVTPGRLGGSPSDAGPSPGKSSAENHRLLMWRAQMGPSTVHFLGSVHVARPELYPLDPRIESAFAASDALVLEVVLDEKAQIAAAQRMMELGRLAPGVKLENVVSPDTYRLVNDAARRHGLSLLGLHGFRPWFIALTMTTQALEKQGFSGEQGIDEHFRRSAQGHKRLEALESVEQQLGLFAQLSKSDEEQMLRESVEEIDQYADELDSSFRLWRAGDATGLDQVLLGPMRSAYPALFAQLFTERNQGMLAKLTELAKRPGNYFVVVGAGHLVGKGGIVDLLSARGIHVEQL